MEGFTRRYAVHMLVYYELLDTMDAATTREKQIKAGSRAKKLQLIESAEIMVSVDSVFSGTLMNVFTPLCLRHARVLYISSVLGRPTVER